MPSSASGPTLDAVFGEHVPILPPGRRARLLFADDSSAYTAGVRDLTQVRAAWIADAIAAIARDADLRVAARQLTATLPSAAFDQERWHTIAANRNGDPIAAASADATDRLVIAAASRPDQLATAVLIRAMLNAMAPPTSFDRAEVMAISDAQLRAWSREPGDAAPPRRETADDDDRRVLWITVLVLLGVETWMRRHAR